jgi:hypothetical protein
VITDHTGAAYSSPSSGCDLQDAEAVVGQVVNVTAGQAWRVDIGMCPPFREHHPEYLHGLRDRATYVLVIAGTAASLIVGVFLLSYFGHRELALQVSLAKQVSPLGR